MPRDAVRGRRPDGAGGRGAARTGTPEELAYVHRRGVRPDGPERRGTAGGSSTTRSTPGPHAIWSEPRRGVCPGADRAAAASVGVFRASQRRSDADGERLQLAARPRDGVPLRGDAPAVAVRLRLQHQPLHRLPDLHHGLQVHLDLLQGPGAHVVDQRRDQALRRLPAVLGREDPGAAGRGAQSRGTGLGRRPAGRGEEAPTASSRG